METSLSSNNAALSSKEWFFSDEWEQFSSEESIRFEEPELFNKEPILNQDEIESLLDHYNSPKKQVLSGFEKLIETKKSKYDNVTFLNNILKNFSQKCLNHWRRILPKSDDVTYVSEDTKLISLKDYLEETLIAGVTRVIRSKECNSPLLINFSSECFSSLIDSLLGGSHTKEPCKTYERQLTKIEDNIILYFIAPLLVSLQNAFSKFVKYEFYLENENKFSDLLKVSNLTDKSLFTKFMFRIDSSVSNFNIIFPITFLEDFIQKLNKKDDSHKQLYSMLWQNYLVKELESTNITIEAKLSSLTFSLEEIFTWEVGTQIKLPIKLSSLIALESSGVELMTGELGQSNNSFAIQIKHNTLNAR